MHGQGQHAEPWCLALECGFACLVAREEVSTFRTVECGQRSYFGFRIGQRPGAGTKVDGFSAHLGPVTDRWIAERQKVVGGESPVSLVRGGSKHRQGGSVEDGQTLDDGMSVWLLEGVERQLPQNIMRD